MKVELNLKSDSYNSSFDQDILKIEFFNDDARADYVWIEIGDREVSVNKEELKKILSII